MGLCQTRRHPTRTKEGPGNRSFITSSGSRPSHEFLVRAIARLVIKLRLCTRCAPAREEAHDDDDDDRADDGDDELANQPIARDIEQPKKTDDKVSQDRA